MILSLEVNAAISLWLLAFAPTILLIALEFAQKDFFLRPFRAIFFIGFFFYFIIFPILVFLDLIDLNYDQMDVIRCSYISLIFLASFLCSYQFFTNKQNTEFHNQFLVSSKLKYIFLIFLLFLFISIIEIRFLSKPILYFIILIPLLISLLNSMNNAVFQKISLVLFYCCFMIVCSFYYDSRRVFIGLAILFILTWSMQFRGVGFRTLVVVIISLLIMLIYITYARSVPLGRQSFDFLHNAQLMVSHLIKIGDFGIAFDNFISIYNDVQDRGFKLFSTIVRVLTYFGGDKFVPARHYDVVLLVVNEGVASFAVGGGTSQSTSIVGELYWNGGLPAVVLAGFGYGYLASSGDNIFWSRPGSRLTLMACVPFVFEFFRGGVSTILIYAVSTIVIIMVFLYLCVRLSIIKAPDYEK